LKILVLSSLAYSLVNFRGALLDAMRDNGHDVVAVAPDRDLDVEQRLAASGIALRIVPMSRTGIGPFEDLRTTLAYLRLMRKERPDIIFAYTQKPIIYGGLAARLYRKARFFAMMSGLGYMFSTEAQHRTFLRRIFCRLYREGLRPAVTLFVFNRDDRPDMIDAKIITQSKKVIQVPGSGIDVTHFARQPIPDGPVAFLLIGRLMRDKGVYDFIEAARIVRETHPTTCFRILGRPEANNLTGLDLQEVTRLTEEGVVEFLAETRDVRPTLKDATVFVLPSYHREGLPRTILEALATGRPVITTDTPGCRDPIEPGVNGLLVPPKAPKALAQAMIHLIDHPALVEAMAKRSRHLAETVYNVDLVNAQLLDAMGLIRPKSAHSEHLVHG
jgi:glycosyltransferase involved in cell wall biosynthesis